MSSKKVKLASASIDENGKATGGKAGDQTGKEVKIQDYYVHSKGWRVFRPISPEQAEKIAFDGEEAAKNNKIGYDQNQRNTLYEASKPYGFNCKMVKTPCECDCSALVRVCCAYAGITLPASFRTANEAKELMKTGAFEELTGDKYTKSSDYLKRGDILVTATRGHTVIVITNGKNANEPIITTGKVKITGGSVWVRKGPGVRYTAIGVAHKNDIFNYGGETSIDGWNMIDYDTEDGPVNAWVSGKYSVLI